MSVQSIDIFFLLPLLILGIVVSWEDYFTNKVRNKWLAAAVIYGALALLLFSPALGWPDYMLLPSGYASKAAVNGAIALLTGFFLYKYNFMASGDAKLFFVFSLLLPLKYYSRAYLPVFPSFTLLVNIFLPFLIYVFFQAIWHAAGRGIKYLRGGIDFDGEKARRAAGKKIMAAVNMVIVMVALYILMQKFRELVIGRYPSLNFNPMATYLVFFVIYRTLVGYVRKRAIPAMAAGIIFFYVLWGLIYERAALAQTMQKAVITMIVFLAAYAVIRKLLDYHIRNSAIDRVGLDEIEPGMRLAEINFTDSEGRAVKGGLAADQVETLKNWARGKNLAQIGIYRKFPFAAWTFLGVIITVIFRQPIIYALYALAQNYGQ